jgi:hypothetical protein
MDPIVIAFSFAESIPLGRVLAMEGANTRRVWGFRYQPSSAPITPDGELAQHALAWWYIKIRHLHDPRTEFEKRQTCNQHGLLTA